MQNVNQQTGEVMPSMNVIKNWNKDGTLESLLKGLRKEMETSSFRNLSQPPEGSTF